MPEGYIRVLVKFSPVVSEEKSFDSVDGQLTNDGRFPSYKLPRSLWLRGAKMLSQYKSSLSFHTAPLASGVYGRAVGPNRFDFSFVLSG